MQRATHISTPHTHGIYLQLTIATMHKYVRIHTYVTEYGENVLRI